MGQYQKLPIDQIEYHSVKSSFLVDEVSSTEYYIGESRNTSDESYPKWRIRKIWKIGSVWRFGYPNGDQSFNYKWSNRFGYTYLQ